MFNLGLYKEGLRRIKILGIIFTAGMLFLSTIIPITYVTAHARRLADARRFDWDWVLRNPYIQINGQTFIFIFVITAVIGIPILTYGMFSTFNSRNSSDFFHAIPHKRESIFLSGVLAVFTFTFVPAWIASLAMGLIYRSSPYAQFDTTSILWWLIGLTVIGFIIFTGVLLGMALSGSLLPNIVTTGFILFVPRVLIIIFVETVTSLTPVINRSNFGMIARMDLNLLFLPFHQTSGQNFMPTVSSVIYSSVLVVVYFALALWAFKTRPSEIAGHPGTKRTQAVVRIVLTFLMTLPISAMIILDGEVVGILIVAVLTVLGYLLYEFLSTRKVRNIKSILKDFGVVLVLNVVFLSGIMGVRGYYMRPIQTNNVVRATVVDLNERWSSGIYVNERMMAIDFFDTYDFSEVLTLAHNEMIDGTQQWSGRWLRVAFELENGRTLYRSVQVEIDTPFHALLQANETYQQLVREIPTEFEEIWDSSGMLSQQQAIQVLNLLREEFQTVDFSVWYPSIQHGFFGIERLNFHEELRRMDFGTIEISRPVENEMNRWAIWHVPETYRITEIMPRTFELFYELSNGQLRRHEDWW